MLPDGVIWFCRISACDVVYGVLSDVLHLGIVIYGMGPKVAVWGCYEVREVFCASGGCVMFLSV